MTRTHRICIALIVIAAIVALVACGGSSTPSPTPAGPSPTPGPGTPTVVAAPGTTSPATTATSTPAAAATVAATWTPSPSVIDPCTLLLSLEGQPLVPGPSFTLDATTKWQLCLGGAGAGNSEKYLFRTTDGGATWPLISRTTLGNPTPEAGVGSLPNGNGVVQILFTDATNGWMGLNSPGINLYRSQDGGVTWTPVPVIPAAVPVTSITFADPMHGTVVTPEETYTTSDGGVTWTH